MARCARPRTCAASEFRRSAKARSRAEAFEQKASSRIRRPKRLRLQISDWEFYHAGDSNKTDDHLKPVAAPSINPSATSAVGKSGNSAKQQPSAISKTIGVAPLSAGGGISLQVAALTKESDAMALANTLRKKNFPTFVQSPQGDKYYHVLVGPYADQKAVDNARKGLEVAGFKAIVKH